MGSFLKVFFDHASQRDLVNDLCGANGLNGVVYEWDTPVAPPPPQPAPSSSRPVVPTFMDLFGTDAKPVISHFAPNEMIDLSSDEEEDVKVVGGGEKRKTINERIECMMCDVMIGGYGGGKERHVMLHLRVPPFHCPQCDYTGRQRRYVLRHMRIQKHRGDIINSLDQQEVDRLISECFPSSNSAPLHRPPANRRRGRSNACRKIRKRRDEWSDDDDTPLAPPRTVIYSDHYHIPHTIVRTDMVGSFRVEAADGQKLVKKEEPRDSMEMADGEMGKEEPTIVKQETESPSRNKEVSKQETSDGAAVDHNNDDVEMQRNSSTKADGSGKKMRNGRRTTATATITCQLCHKTLALSSRYSHVFAHYSNYAPPPFQCSQCARDFHWKSDASRHMRTQGCGGEVIGQKDERVYARVQVMCFGDAVIVKKEEPEEEEEDEQQQENA